MGGNFRAFDPPNFWSLRGPSVVVFLGLAGRTYFLPFLSQYLPCLVSMLCIYILELLGGQLPQLQPENYHPEQKICTFTKHVSVLSTILQVIDEFNNFLFLCSKKYRNSQ